MTAHPLSRLMLAPAASLFASAVRVRNRLFDAGILRRERMPVAVLSVGNVTVGGTGKTPLVAAIATVLSAAGSRVAILTRGYGGRRGGRPLLLRAGTVPGQSPPAWLDGAACGRPAPTAAGARDPGWDALDASAAEPSVVGDEPLLLAGRLAGVPVLVGADRRATGRLAAGVLGADVLVLDDGFQHRWIERDLDIVVLDALDPFGRYRLLPAGLLREPLDSLGRADVFVVSRSHPGDGLRTLQEVLRKYNDDAPLFRAHHRAIGFVPLGAGRGCGWIEGGEILPPGAFSARPIAAFCGIGNPEGFRSTLESHGAYPVVFETFRDHHPYTAGELERLMRQAARAGAEALITTEKDAVRIACGKHPPGEALLAATCGGAGGSSLEGRSTGIPLCALRIRCDVEPADSFRSLLLAAARSGPSGYPPPGGGSPTVAGDGGT